MSQASQASMQLEAATGKPIQTEYDFYKPYEGCIQRKPKSSYNPISEVPFTPRYVDTITVAVGGYSREVRVYTPETDHCDFWFSGSDVIDSLNLSRRYQTVFNLLENGEEKGKSPLTFHIVSLEGLRKMVEIKWKDPWEQLKRKVLYEQCSKFAEEKLKEIRDLAYAEMCWTSKEF